MKKILLFVAVLFIANTSFSQLFSWGIKGGVNSSKITFDDFNIEKDQPLVTFDGLTPDASGNITIPVEEINGQLVPDPQWVADHMNVNVPTLSFTPSSYEMGYHFGVFARIKVLAIFIQPELIFSQTNASIDVSDVNNLWDNFTESTVDIKYNNFDIPVMVGVKLGPLRLNAGPVATFKLSSDPSAANDEINEMLNDFTAVTKTATFGGQAGVGIDILKKVTLDVRYEFPLSKLGDDVTIAGQTFKTDQRQSQFIASIGWMF
jgi:hypothetical protein